MSPDEAPGKHNLSVLMGGGEKTELRAVVAAQRKRSRSARQANPFRT